MKKTLVIFLFILISIYLSNILSQGCSQCKLVAAQSSELDENSFSNNINNGILYLLAIPYILILFFFRKKLLYVIKFVFKK